MRRVLVTVLLMIAILPVFTMKARAEWVEDGIPITVGSITGSSGEWMPDGEGGFFIVFTNGSSSSANIHAQRIDRYGNLLWGPDGVVVCDEDGFQGYPVLCSDGMGGMIVAFGDERLGNRDIFAQRIDPDGNQVWAKAGILACTQTSDQYGIQIVADGESGAYICWTDSRNGNTDIFAQRINFLGSRQWTAEGVAVCTHTDYQYDVRMVAAQAPYGVWIGFTDNRAGAMDSNVYLLRLYPSGSVNYDESYNTGVPICTAANNQDELSMLADGEGGVFLVWDDSRSGGWDIYGKYVSSSWSGHWPIDGAEICTEATSSQIFNSIALSSDNYLLVTWRDSRGTINDIYGQKIGARGAKMWATDGAMICDIPGEHLQPDVVSDGEGGMIVTWTDRRTTSDDIWAQRLNSSGSRMWDYEGSPVCTAPGYQSPHGILPDGEGGAFFFYSDGRDASNYNNYVQRIERNGYWGYPSPFISSVEDVPGDQGGYVHLTFEASRLDLWPEEDIDYYSIWRALSPVMAMQLVENGARLIEDPSELMPVTTSGKETPLGSADSPSVPDKVVRRELVGASTFYWEQIEPSFPAEHLGTYGYTAQTLFDFTPVSPGFHYFQVIAYGGYGTEYWISAPDSGWSEDNLAPGMPMNVIGLPEYGPPAVTIEWDPNTEEDLFGYRIYRSDVPQFIPGPATMIAETTDPTIHDDYSTWASAYYMISAVDIHGNESLFAELVPGTVTGDDLPGTPAASYLAQNYPNPFNPVTTIAFGLSRASHVKLRIYDPAGRLVRIVLDEDRPAGNHNVHWDGLDDGGSRVSSGVYFYRLLAGEFEETKKMVLLR